jgi:hypothetical protein
MAPLDPRTRAHLIDTGTLTPSGLGQTAQLHTCPRCWQWVIRGLDHRRCALEVIADPVSLNARTELAALIGGRLTYELWGREIERRTPTKIARGMPKPVIATHQCGTKTNPDPHIIRLFIPTYHTAAPLPANALPPY